MVQLGDVLYTAMASLLFHILLVFIFLGTCSSSYTQHIIIQVSDTGIDEPSCMQNGESCKSLTYAMEELSNFRQSTNIIVITVNITCNQTITKYPTCNLFPTSGFPECENSWSVTRNLTSH